jgi:hypothetical protein
MSNFRLIISILLIINCGGIYSIYGQEKKDHKKSLPMFSGRQLVGLQYNPLFTKDYKVAGSVAGIRYGYKITDPVILGAEASGYFFKEQTDNKGLTYDDNPGIGLGLFARYSSPARKRVQGFIEISPIYHISFKDTVETDVNSGNTFAIYMAPGFSIFSRNRKFSFDLCYKISTQSFTNERHSMLAYKVNYHFK